MQETSFTERLKAIVEEQAVLDRGTACSLLQAILRGEASDVQIAALLGGIAARGERASEIAGFVDAMHAASVPFPEITEAERLKLVDTCGTGGDGSNTFNISTAAALVAAAAGATVAKHGNRAVTSKCGSADVLEELGIAVGLAPSRAAQSLRERRFAFLHAPDLHPAMKVVMPVRRALGVRTVFNILGPLSNPAGAKAQVMGVYAARLLPLVAEAMVLLGVRHAMVVHGETDEMGGGLDEFSLSGPTEVAEVRDGGVTRYTVVPEDFGLERAPLSALAGGDARSNAEILQAVFAGERGARRDVVVLNAAAVLVVAGVADDLRAGIGVAAAAIDSGAVVKLVEQLRRG